MEKPKSPSFTWMYGLVLLLVALPTFAVGIYIAASKEQFGLLAAGCASIVAILVTWPLARSLEQARDASIECTTRAMNPLNERVQQMSVLLNQISEQQLLSDRAKSVAYREKDRDAVRRALHEEISRKDWEAAMLLANDIEAQFGYKQEADRFRVEINQRWQEETRKEVGAAMEQIERFIRIEQWANAHREAERLAQLYPNDAQVKNLPNEIENRRQAHKKQLLESWNEAVRRNDVDGSIEILKNLDPYLTPAEAESLQEPARHVFKEKLNSLRTQFSLAVQDH